MFKRATNLLIVVGILLAVIAAAFFYYYQSRTQTIIIATNEEGSQSHQFVSALKTVAASVEPHLNIKIVQTNGSAEIMNLLQESKADFGVVQLDTPPAPNVDTVAFLYPQVYHLMVHTDSDIQSPADLKGRTIATPDMVGGTYSSLLSLLDYYGMDSKSVTILPISDSLEREAAFRSGKVDAIFRVTTLGHPSIREFLQSTDARLIPFNQFEAMRLFSPTLFKYVIPMGTYRAAGPAIPPVDLQTVGVPTELVVREKVSPTIVRTLTRILFENKNDIAAITPIGAFVSEPDAGQSVIPRLHQGALAYYNRDQPSFFEKYYNQISLLATLIPLMASVYFAVRAFLLTRQRDRAYRYNMQMASLLTQLMSSPTASRAKKAELQLLEMLEDVINDMNRGDIEISDLQAFSFVWDKAMEAVRYREASLTRKKKPAAQKGK
jgi:uncharacterized protein